LLFKVLFILLNVLAALTQLSASPNKHTLDLGCFNAVSKPFTFSVSYFISSAKINTWYLCTDPSSVTNEFDFGWNSTTFLYCTLVLFPYN